MQYDLILCGMIEIKISKRHYLLSNSHSFLFPEESHPPFVGWDSFVEHKLYFQRKILAIL